MVVSLRKVDAPIAVDRPHKDALILLVEDDPEIQRLMVQVLSADGHRVLAASNGAGALALLDDLADVPDIVLADYNLPDGMNGLEVASCIQARFERRIAVVILSGDISTEGIRRIASQDCLALNKPVEVDLLLSALQRLLNQKARILDDDDKAIRTPQRPIKLFVVDDDERIRLLVRQVFEASGHSVEDYADGESFLSAYHPGNDECVLIDAVLPGISGAEVLSSLRMGGFSLPAIMITGRSDVAMAVNAMKSGASDFIEKPASPEDLLASVGRAIDRARDASDRLSWQTDAANHLAALTPRQQQVLTLVLAGSASKVIAYELGISQRTVENHRASIMKKTGTKSLPALARLAYAASA